MTLNRKSRILIENIVYNVLVFLFAWTLWTLPAFLVVFIPTIFGWHRKGTVAAALLLSLAFTIYTYFRKPRR